MSAYVGQQLRQARQNKNLSLEQISRVTYIRVTYLEALEAGQLERLPSRAQAHGFLRTYAKQLGLPPEPLLAALEQNTSAADGETAPMPDSPARVPPTEAVFVEIGQALRQHREMLGFKLEDIERQTHVRVHYLRALETGNLDALPSPVQGRGMLNNYAAFLGLDPDPLLSKFADGLQARLMARRGPRAGRVNPRSPEVTSLRSRPPLRTYLSNDLIFGSTLGIALLIFVIWAAIRVSSLSQGELASATAPAIVDVLAPEPTSTPTSASGTPEAENSTESESGSETTPTLDLPLPIFNEEGVQLYIIVRQRAWMRITIDGQVAFEGRVLPGSAYTYSGQERIELLTGNGGALQVFYNQADLGPLGTFGEVIQRTFTPTEILLPTATITPTPTVTDTPEFVETPTMTPTSTP